MKSKIRTRADGHWHRLEIVEGKEAVSWLSVLDATIRILGTPVRMGGIGGVGTKPEHRMKGRARRLLNESVRYMTGLGQDVSMLFGIPDFYNKFGFLPCLPTHVITLATRDAERAAEGAAGFRTRPATERDYAFIVRLYNEDNRERAATFVRDERDFRGFRKGSYYSTPVTTLMLEDDAGRPAGYAVADDSRTEVKVVEANVTDRRAFWTLLSELAKMAVERRTGQIELQMARDHPFVRFVRRYGCQVQSTYPRMSTGMMRMLNQELLLRKLRPALKRRIGYSPFGDRNVRLTIETDLARTDLRFGDRAGRSGPPVAASVKLGQDKLMQILVGYRAADDVLSDPDVQSQGDAAALLEVLFGGQEPYVWKPDWF